MNTCKHRTTELVLVLALVGVIVFTTPGCIAPAPGAGQEPDSANISPLAWATSEAGLDFLEAVFRYKLENYSTNYDKVGFVVLGLNAPDGFVDLPPAFLSRFVDYPSITPTYEAEIPNWGRGFEPNQVKRKDSDGRGVAFIIEDLCVINVSTIFVETRTQGACKWVSSYRFELRDGQWVMAEELWRRVS